MRVIFAAIITVMNKLFSLVILTTFLLNHPKSHKRLDKLNADTIVYFMRNGDYMTYEKKEADFFRIVARIDSGRASINDFYLDGKRKSEGVSLTQGMNFKPLYNGKVTNYFVNGNKSQEISYENGKLKGESITYYPNGNLQSIVIYQDDIYYKEYRDSTGAILAINGNGKWIEDAEHLGYIGGSVKGQVVEGKREGVWLITSAKGEVTERKYKANQHQHEPLNVNDGIKRIYPSFKGGDAGLNKFLSKNIRYTDVGRDYKIEGTSILTFMIEKDGTLTDVKIVRRLGGGLDEEAARVLKLSPPWIPATENGNPVRVQFTIPVYFYLKS